ncbi:T9SS type B sorting domain-containing protein [Flaviramulus sp. BrNp1-15]|uniref:T9SS type B sorting domain-containing protein n=1 Tax=Flaviramulus sp. BrNp1-15 TaxID=2916754 RepID=UPI001EE84462|nr:T9SS type B sorting domain-containing protein [Flaviramulus sp. BrNp1-15]ULC58713.1 T9SS type B sorting domain-containing protein [Flaviramulus sp. BrNp1-15]
MKLHYKLNLLFVLITFFYSNFCFTQNDCVDAIIACGNSDINLDVNGSGTREFNNSCSSNENNSVWLQVTLVTDGTLGFTLTPNSSAITEDYDFFVFGPNVSCGNVGNTIRCSTTNPQAANQGNNLTGMNSTSNDTSEGPGSDGDSFVKWLDVLAGETYFIVIDRPIGNSPFSLEWTGTAQFSDPPTDESTTAGNSLDFESCDVTTPFDDEFTTFNLSDNTTSIIGTQTDVTITYHDSASDANIGINELTSPYTNISNPQTIFARITNNVTGCFELTDFELSVNLGPDFTPPSNYILCDNLNDGDDKNGQATFDLSSKNDEILNGQNPSDFNVLYFDSQINAENRNSQLPNNYYNNTPFDEEIFVRIEDVLNSDCKSITTLNLIANPNPDAFNHSILQCDEDGLLDGETLFNLNEANNDLTSGISDRSTRFYTDVARNNEINGDSFNNTSNPQTIYVEVINDVTGCISNSELTLEVSLTDSNDTFLTTCDDDGIEDGFHIFNLSDADDEVINGLPAGLNIDYYETYNDALLEENNLGTTFTNTIPFLQTIFARVENTNNCYGISEVLLTVNELPNITEEDLQYYCLNTFPQTTPINADLLNDSPNNYTYNWSTGETSYEIQINQQGNYSVTVTNIITGCSKERIINVEASNIATFESIEVVDASPNNSITVLVSGEGIYEYRLLDNNNVIVVPYQESNSFESVSPGIYSVSVRDIKNDCGTVNDKVSVIGFPKFFTPNNDGFHDTWQISGVSEMFQPNTKIQIFNRFGKLIKELNPLEEGWNGLLNGQKLPSDDYWFSVKLQDGRIFKNHFTLKY